MSKGKFALLFVAVLVLGAVMGVFLVSCNTDQNVKTVSGSNGIYNFTAKGENATIDKYLLEEDIVHIPETIDYKISGVDYTYNVVCLGDESFKQNKTVEQVFIPESVISIGASAFEACEKLSVVTFANPDKNTDFTLGTATFKDIKTLKSITLPDGTKEIPDECFMNSFATGTTTAQTDVFMYDAVEKIGQSAFENSKIQRINLSKALTEIGIRAFASCSSLTAEISLNTETAEFNESETFTFPETLTTIARQAFYHCQNIKKYIIPASVTTMGGGCFAGGYYGANLEIDPANEYFYYSSKSYALLSKDKKVLISHTCYSVNLTNFTSTGNVDVNNIEKIEEYAFGKDTSNSTAYTLPASLKEIGKYAFRELTDSSTNADDPRPRFDFKSLNCTFVSSSFSANALFVIDAGGLTEVSARAFKAETVDGIKNNWTIKYLV